MQRPALLKDDVRLIATLRPQIKGAPMMVTYSRVGSLYAKIRLKGVNRLTNKDNFLLLHNT